MTALKSQMFSGGLHVAAMLALLLLSTRARQFPPGLSHPVLVFRPSVAAPQRAGGSNQTRLSARSGVPPPPARRTFIPPASRAEPKLPIPVTVAFESLTIDISPAPIGDPASRLLTGGLGSNGVNGIGDHGCCRGVGDSDSGEPGIDGGAAASHKITAPQLIYKVEPEFSEASRKAKYQGVVVLAIEVGADGRTRNLRVLQPLGLGLDEKALQAVAQWRFRPGLRDGKPVVTTATVEVSFRLM